MVFKTTYRTDHKLTILQNTVDQDLHLHCKRKPSHNTYNWTQKKDPRSDLCNLSSCEKKARKKEKEKKKQTWRGFEPMTTAIPVQCSTNWAVSSQLGSRQIVSSHNHYITSSVPISASFIPTSADGMYGVMIPSGQENAIKLPDYTAGFGKTFQNKK